MKGVHEKDVSSQPTYPQTRQRALYRAHKEVRLIVYFPWIIVALGLVWTSTIMGLILHSPDGYVYNNDKDWSLIPVRGSSFLDDGSGGTGPLILQDTGMMSLLIYSGLSSVDSSDVDIAFDIWSLSSLPACRPPWPLAFTVVNYS
jgi:hypothetical protein